MNRMIRASSAGNYDLLQMPSKYHILFRSRFFLISAAIAFECIEALIENRFLYYVIFIFSHAGDLLNVLYSCTISSCIFVDIRTHIEFRGKLY